MRMIDCTNAHILCQVPAYQIHSDPPIPQIVYYQPGIGTEQNFYSEYIEGGSSQVCIWAS
jgi:hypothetical protein